MFLTITPNLALDRTLVVHQFETGGVFRAAQVSPVAGGKGINVARALSTLGARALCLGFIGGHTGRWVSELALHEGLDCAWTPIEGETRTCISIVNPDVGGETTQINEPGPHTSASDWANLTEDALTYAVDSQATAFCGSLPPSSDPVAVRDCLSRLARESHLWVDTSGDALRLAADVQPYGIKVNHHEIGALLGVPVPDANAALKAAAALHERGIACVVVTLGAAGAVMVTDQGQFEAAPPPIRALSTVGSGDSFLAGLMFGLSGDGDHAAALRLAIAVGAANALTIGAGRFDAAAVDRLRAATQVRLL